MASGANRLRVRRRGDGGNKQHITSYNIISLRVCLKFATVIFFVGFCAQSTRYMYNEAILGNQYDYKGPMKVTGVSVAKSLTDPAVWVGKVEVAFGSTWACPHVLSPDDMVCTTQVFDPRHLCNTPVCPVSVTKAHSNINKCSPEQSTKQKLRAEQCMEKRYPHPQLLLDQSSNTNASQQTSETIVSRPPGDATPGGYYWPVMDNMLGNCQICLAQHDPAQQNEELLRSIQLLASLAFLCLLLWCIASSWDVSKSTLGEVTTEMRQLI